MFRHDLRVSEACGLELSQVDIESRVLHVQRLKKGLSTTHPLTLQRHLFLDCERDLNIGSPKP